jgi:23S rRNA pseudouridine2605 synthase
VSSDDPIPSRLGKHLADGTSLSRRAVAEAVAAGRVRIGGQRATDPDRLVFADDEVSLDGEPVRPRRRQRTILFHKPAELTTTLSDTLGRADLSGPLADMPDGCAPVGRLDRATTGALLLTTDGDLLNAILLPEHHVPKVYRLSLDEAVADDDERLAQLVEGVETPIGRLRAEAVRVGRRRVGETVVGGPPDHGETELWLTLREGKNRQIRRMCRALKLRLRHLHRDAIGPVRLGSLAEGEWRDLSDAEVEALWRAVGGREHVRERRRAALRRQAEKARERGAPDERLEAWLALD